MDLRSICYFCGGFGGAQGLDAAGIRVVLAVDYNEDALRAHRQFLPSLPPVIADLSKEDPVDVMIANGIDPQTFGGIILTTSPCTGFADCGKRDPDAATNKLLSVPMRLSTACPRAWIVNENVRGLLSLRNRPKLLELLEAFRSDGRDVPTVAELREHYIMDAQHYHCPQHRERVFIVAPPPGSPRISLPPPTTPTPMTLGQAIGPGSGFVDPDPRAILLSQTEAVCNFAKN